MADYNSAYTGAQIDAAIAKAGTAVQPGTFNAHKSRHASGGADAIAPADIGAVVKATTTATLTVAGWAGASAPFTQTVNVSGVTASNAVVVSPVAASHAAYVAAGCYCSAQGGGTLTFTCATAKPSGALSVNVLALT